jgi:hypothetical protein
MFSADGVIVASEMCCESFNWNGLVAYPAQNHDVYRQSVRTCWTVVNVSRPAKPNYPALKALEESALLSLFRQVLWRKGFETIHAEIIRRLCGSEIGGHAPKLVMGLSPPIRTLGRQMARTVG